MKKLFSVSCDTLVIVKRFSIVSSVFVLLAAACFGQQNDVVFLEPQKAQPSQTEVKTVLNREERTSINVGVLMGGGSLIGADLEFLAGKRVGLQLGAGISSMGFGINYHFKSCINSQFVSIQYFHQGFGDSHYGSYLGPMYVFRARKILQIGIGFGTVLTKGDGLIEYYESRNLKVPSVMALYNIGLYFPL